MNYVIACMYGYRSDKAVRKAKKIDWQLFDSNFLIAIDLWVIVCCCHV